ncbi:IS701 family transposase [Streptomyces sp. enrichment culture]|uniref:IS701 family transposase n=1 Tax=Streptomyces sp. enrichment culture TaxID=1795815 RepID=UPI003F5714B9
MSLQVFSERGHEPLVRFAEQVFGHLPRSDQRRRACAYLHGLLATPGRKTVSAMSAATDVPSIAPHSMRQFVNASSWDWRPARAELARWAAERMPVEAWGLKVAVVAKRGVHSPGVHRRFVPSAGRSLNCQVALGLFLVSRAEAIPVDWALLLPDAWADDPHRRSRARIPSNAAVPMEQAALDLVDAQISGGGLGAVPVVADLSACTGARQLVRGLGLRRRDFVVALRPQGGTPPGARARGSGPLRHGAGRAVPQAGPPSAPALPPYRYFSLPGRRPARTWMTSMTRRHATDLRLLAGLDEQAARAVSRLGSGFGLLDFEGRSYPGWHHHMTMVSAAYAFSRLEPRLGPVRSGPGPDPHALDGV